MVPVWRVLRCLLPSSRQNLATRLCADPGGRLEDHRALASSVHWADRGSCRSSEYFAFRVVYAFVDDVRWRARNAALGAGVLEIRLSPFNLGHPPAISFLRRALLRLAVGHALALALHLPHSLPSFYLADWA